MFTKLNKKLIVALVAIIAVVAVVGGSLAWFVTRSSLPQQFGIKSFNAGAEVYFLVDEAKVSADNYKDSDGLYTLSLDKNDENYIGNLRAAVTLDGGRACVRVRMSHEWSDADGLVSQYTTSVPYTFADDWYDNRNEDYCVYYKAADNSGKADFDRTQFITGFDETKLDTLAFDAGISVRVLIEVDAVQVNRYPQLWNIDSLPWK